VIRCRVLGGADNDEGGIGTDFTRLNKEIKGYVGGNGWCGIGDVLLNPEKIPLSRIVYTIMMFCSCLG